MILTRKDYEKAYKILDTEWENEVKPALVEINKALGELKQILEPYETTARLNSIGIDPYSFVGDISTRLQDLVGYAKHPMCFYPFVQEEKIWTCILTLDPTNRESRKDMSDIHKGLLYWRKRVNEIKDCVCLFHENVNRLENRVTNLINETLIPLADKEANEFLFTFGITKKVQKVKITISLTNVK